MKFKLKGDKNDFAKHRHAKTIPNNTAPNNMYDFGLVLLVTK